MAAVASESSRLRAIVCGTDRCSSSLMISAIDRGMCMFEWYVKRKIKLNQLIRIRSSSPRKEIQYFVPSSLVLTRG